MEKNFCVSLGMVSVILGVKTYALYALSKFFYNIKSVKHVLIVSVCMILT